MLTQNVRKSSDSVGEPRSGGGGGGGGSGGGGSGGGTDAMRRY